MRPLPHDAAGGLARRAACALIVGSLLAACSNDATSAPASDAADPSATVPATDTGSGTPQSTAPPSTASPGIDGAGGGTVPASEPAPDGSSDVVPGVDDRIAATRALFAGIEPDGPGCSVAVGDGGDIVFAEAFGLASIELGVPNTTTTVMDVGSVSKQFSALAILLLEADGELSLDDDVRTYVPELGGVEVPITLRQLMHHQSGLPDYIGLLADRLDEPTDAADALAALAGVTELDFAPGSAWAYSNTNYFLFSVVVERVRGLPLDKFLDERVFQPLDLAMMMDPLAAIEGKAESYRLDGGRWVDADSTWSQIGDGGIQTTPTELVRWATQYWAPPIGGSVVGEARFDGAVPVPGTEGHYGAGIFRTVEDDGTVVLDHSGGWAGFATLFTVLPGAERAIAVSCNGITDRGAVGDLDAAALVEIWGA